MDKTTTKYKRKRRRMVLNEPKLELTKRRMRSGMPVSSKLDIIDSRDSNLISKIKNQFYQNKKTIRFTELKPLIDNNEFVDIVVEKKISFSTVVDSKMADSLSRMLLYISNKEKMGRGGNPEGYKNVQLQANNFAKKIGEELDDLHKSGFESLFAKAKELNRLGIKTMRGKEWQAISVKNTWERWKKIKAEQEEKNKSASKSSPKPE